jgi:hypothetical protein
MTSRYLPSRDLSRDLSSRAVIHLPAVLVGAVAIVTAYLLLTLAILPGVADLVAALPDAVRLGALLVVSSGTRLVGGWFAVRRLRRDRGLRRRTEGLPSALAAGFLAWMNVTALAAVLGLASGTSWSTWLPVVELLRWPAEAALGGLMAFPGQRDDSTGRYS